jgi:hypothetical protein
MDGTMLGSDWQTSEDMAMIEDLTGQSKLQIGNACSMLKIDLGWVISTMFRQDCPVCIVLLNSMPDYLPFRDAYIVLCSIDSRDRYLKDYSRIVKTNGDTKCLFALLHNDLSDSEETWAYLGLGLMTDATDANQLGRPMSDQNSTMFSGRIVSEGRIDTQHARSWVTQCIDHHSEACKPLKSRSIERIPLVDVMERKLVN